MKKLNLAGLVAAVHSPFNADGTLNLHAVENQARHLAASGIQVAFICGSTGESHSLTLHERRVLAQRWLEVAPDFGLGIIVHVGSNCLSDARELAAHAGRGGAIALSALAPSYFRPRTLDDLIDWCALIAAEAPSTPFYFYDIPVLTGVRFCMRTFLEQADRRIPTLNGIKFTNSDLMAYAQCLGVKDGAFDIPWGIDEALLSALAIGAKGAVGSSYNFAAPLYQRLLSAFARGDLHAARLEQNRSVQLIQVLAGHGYMGAAKAVMKMIGVDVGPARMPNNNPTPGQLTLLRQELETVGFFDWIRVSGPQAQAGA